MDSTLPRKLTWSELAWMVGVIGSILLFYFLLPTASGYLCAIVLPTQHGEKREAIPLAEVEHYLLEQGFQKTFDHALPLYNQPAPGREVLYFRYPLSAHQPVSFAAYHGEGEILFVACQYSGLTSYQQRRLQDLRREIQDHFRRIEDHSS